MKNKKVVGLSVKHAGLAIPDPTQTEKGSWTVLCMVNGHLVAYLRDRVELHYQDYLQLLTYYMK